MNDVYRNLWMRRGIALLMLGVFAAVVGCSGGGNDNQPKDAEFVQTMPGDSAAAGDEEGRQIVADALRAHGGETTARPKWTRGYVKFRTKGGMVPSALGECTVEDTFDFPRRQKRISSWVADGKPYKMIHVINGETVWTKATDTAITEMPNLAPPRAEHPFAEFGDLSPVIASSAKWLRKEDVDGRMTNIVRVATNRGPQVDLALDVDTSLLRRMAQRMTLLDSDAESEIVNYYREYTSIGGRRFPMQVRAFRDPKLFLDIAISEVRLVTEISDDEFTKP